MVDATAHHSYTTSVSTVGGIPLAPRFILERDQLAQVVCQVRFSPVLRLRQRDAVIPIQEALREEYPRYSEQQGVNIMITPGGVAQQANPDPQYRFQDTTGSFSAVLSHDFVALETRDFPGIDGFATRMVALAAAVVEHYAPAEMTRIGLRFINELRLPSEEPETEMARAISAPVLGPIGTPELLGSVDNIQQVLELSTPENKLLVRHGLQRLGGTTVDVPPTGSPPPHMDQPFYLLDIDAYAEAVLPFSVEGIDGRLRTFNDQSRSLFAWAVNREYRSTTLGQRDIEQ